MQEYLDVDLLGYRCPDVAQKMLKALKMLEQSETQYAVIRTIEPSAKRDLLQAINIYYDAKMQLVEVQSTPLTEAVKRHILESKESFELDDLEGLEAQWVMLVSKC